MLDVGQVEKAAVVIVVGIPETSLGFCIISAMFSPYFSTTLPKASWTDTGCAVAAVSTYEPPDRADDESELLR